MSEFEKRKLYPGESPKTLGERLRALRRRQRLSLEKAEEETKVRLKYLVALEKGNYHELPEDVYTIGFLSKYAEFLGVSKEEMIQAYRSERGSSGKFRPLSPKIQLKETKVWLSPKIIVLGLVFLGIAGLLAYVFYSVRSFTSAPNLEISSPVTESVIRQDRIEIIGKTDDEVTLKINDQVVFIDALGNFQETVKLQPGMNNIEIRATNRLKKETVKVIKILAEY